MMNLSRRLLTGTPTCVVARCHKIVTTNSKSYIPFRQHHQQLSLARSSGGSSVLSKQIYSNNYHAKLNRCMNTLSGVTRTNIMNSGNSHSLLTKRVVTLMKLTISFLQQQQQRRSITTVSRLGKRKTCKAVLKRFRRVRGGYLKRWRSGMVKKQRKKSSWRKFRLRGSILVKRPSHLRTLNKMMYKY